MAIQKTRNPSLTPGRVLLCLCISLFIALLLGVLPRIRFVGDLLRDVEMSTRDIRMRLRPPVSDKSGMIVVGLTDLEHTLYGSGIQSREVYQYLLQDLKRLDARAVLFDILFERSLPLDEALALKMGEIPTFISYKFLTQDLFVDEIEQEILGDEADVIPPGILDNMTADTLKETIHDAVDELERLALDRNDAFLALDDDLVRNLDRRQNLLRRKLRQIGTAWLNMNYALRDIEPPDAPVPHAVSAVFPTEILMTGATGIGFINVMKTREGTVRRIPMFIRWNGTIYPHLDLVFVCDYYGIRPSDLKVRFGEFIEFTPRRNASGIRRIPIDREGFITVNFRRSSFHDGPLPTGSSYTMHQVLHYGRHGADAPTRIRPERFKNAVVVVGELTPGGTDVHPTPIAPAYPLVGIHAAIIGMILKNDYIQEPPLWFTLAAIMLAGLSAGLLFGLMEYRPAILAALLIALSYLAVSVILFNRQSLFLPIVRPAGTLILASLFLIIYILGVKEGERRKVRSIFLKTVSPRIGEQILRDFDNVAIWGTRKIVTIMFVDIRGFTSLAESLSPMELVDLLNVYYDTVSDIIFRHDGVVNKFIGDAVMSLFGAPLDLDNAEVRALRAAVEIQEALRTLEVPPLPDGTRRSFGVGIGISSGEVVVGTVGRRKIRIEYTALGDTVNIAERLQGIAPAGDILAGAAVRERALAKQDAFMKERSVVFEPHAPVALKGKEKPVEIFRVSWT